MFSLTKIFDDSFEYRGHTLHVDMAFDNILRLYEMFQDEYFSNFEKMLIALEILIDEYDLIKDISFDEHLELYKYVMQEFLGEKFEDEVSDSDAPPPKKVMDFTKDAGLIYASFMSEYKMDLFELRGQLHWDKFSALLTNLGDKTAFKQVVSYRVMKVPSTKEASEDYRNHVIQMKKIYSLEDDEERAEDLESKLDAVASTFKGKKNP